MPHQKPRFIQQQGWWGGEDCQVWGQATTGLCCRRCRAKLLLAIGCTIFANRCCTGGRRAAVGLLLTTQVKVGRQVIVA